MITVPCLCHKVKDSSNKFLLVVVVLLLNH